MSVTKSVKLCELFFMVTNMHIFLRSKKNTSKDIYHIYLIDLTCFMHLKVMHEGLPVIHTMVCMSCIEGLPCHAKTFSRLHIGLPVIHSSWSVMSCIEGSACHAQSLSVMCHD